MCRPTPTEHLDPPCATPQFLQTPAPFQRSDSTLLGPNALTLDARRS